MATIPVNGQALLVETERIHGTIRVRLEGDVDMATAATLKTTLQEVERAAPAEIVLDMSGLKFVDSSGLHVLLTAARRCERARLPLRAINVPHQARRLFALVALDHTLAIGEDARAPVERPKR